MEWKLLTYGFSAVAITIALTMFLFIKREKVIVLIACADTSWLLLNVLWAVGDLSKMQQALIMAKALFLVGAIFCLLAFWVGDARQRLQFLVLSRMRVVKLFQRP